MSVAGTRLSPLFALAHISKRFGAVWANHDVSFDIAAGEIHAIVGENGAGKSTLLNILYGHLQPDAGAISMRGQPVVFHHPRQAMAAGIGMVHQQLLVFPSLTTLDNIIVGAEPERLGCIDRGRAKEELAALCRLFGFDLPFNARAGELSFALRQQIELLRILFRKAFVLMLDEPTSLLAPPEVKRLLEFLKALKQQGHTILFISHRLQEVFAIADRITVLRQGKWLGTFAATQISKEELALLMVSRESSLLATTAEQGNATSPEQPSPLQEASIVFELRDITTPASEDEVGLKNLSFRIHEGEILGIGGIVGNGQRTLARMLAGLGTATQGALSLNGTDITGQSTSQRLRNGIRWLPANPLEEMTLALRPLWETMLLGRQRQPSFQTKGWLLPSKIRHWAASELHAHEVSYADIEQPVASLSGGNLQKLALAHALAGSPRLVILEQPGRGLDMGAQQRLHHRLRALSATGVAFIIISYDLEELLALCTRIGILFRGQMMGIAPQEQASREILGQWMAGLAAKGGMTQPCPA